MKLFYPTIVLALFLIQIVSASEIRSWESASGANLTATLDKVFGGEAYLIKEDGKTLRIAVSKLSESDQAYLAEDKSQDSSESSTSPNKRAKKAMADLLGDELVNASGEKVSVNDLAGKKVGLYFSAHWCPPCRKFTPMLVDAYNDAGSEEFEVVFVSSDRSSKDMRKYMKGTDMPWLAMPFSGDKIDEVKKAFKVRGIPSLIIIDENGKTITREGRAMVSGKGASAIKNF